jgi:hypothetical protein
MMHARYIVNAAMVGTQSMLMAIRNAIGCWLAEWSMTINDELIAVPAHDTRDSCIGAQRQFGELISL